MLEGSKNFKIEELDSIPLLISPKLVLEITDEQFKWYALHNKDFDDILSIKGKDIMIVASKKEKK